MSNKKQFIIEIITAAFVILFVYAATTKLIDYDKSRLQLGQSPVLTQFAGIVVWLIPVIEYMIALLLTTIRFRLIGLYLSYTLMVMFTAYIIVITRFSDYVPCSCGGVLEKLTWNEHLVFNIVFVLLGAIAILLYPKRYSIAMEAG